MLVEFVERFVQRENVEVTVEFSVTGEKSGVQRLALCSPAALVALACARMIHHDSTHRERGDSKKVCSVLPLDMILATQFHPCLVNDRRRLKSLPTAIPAQRCARDSAKLRVDDLEQTVGRSRVSAGDRSKQASHFARIVRSGVFVRVHDEMIREGCQESRTPDVAGADRTVATKRRRCGHAQAACGNEAQRRSCAVMLSPKKRKWVLNQSMPHVFEPPVRETIEHASPLRGLWNQEVFPVRRPITLELGCGRGDYTVGLARLSPERNFIGVDIKGHRFWHGANAVMEEGLENAVFLRAKVEFIEQHFAQNEVDQIWLTFSDPQPRDDKGTKRITSPIYLERYRRILAGRGPVHIKSDSPLLYERSLKGALDAGFEVTVQTDDLYGPFLDTVESGLRAELEIRTHYEKRWIAEGRKIHYLQVLV